MTWMEERMVENWSKLRLDENHVLPLKVLAELSLWECVKILFLWLSLWNTFLLSYLVILDVLHSLYMFWCVMFDFYLSNETNSIVNFS